MFALNAEMGGKSDLFCLSVGLLASGEVMSFLKGPCRGLFMILPENDGARTDSLTNYGL
jgi:hypothetical protein